MTVVGNVAVVAGHPYLTHRGEKPCGDPLDFFAVLMQAEDRPPMDYVSCWIH